MVHEFAREYAVWHRPHYQRLRIPQDNGGILWQTIMYRRKCRRLVAGEGE